MHIAGPKATGKTATASRIAATVLQLDDERLRSRIETDPGYLSSRRPPVLLDEWQRLPELWDTVRRSVDADRTPNRFILTGSAYPRGAAIHSGAGRILSLRMRPLSLAERGLVPPTVSLEALLRGGSRIEGLSGLGLAEYTREILASGFPAIRAGQPRGSRRELESYVENIIHREFAEQGYAVRAPHTLRRWLRAYAASTGTTASYASILEGATTGEGGRPAKTTAILYREVLESLWLLDEVPAWAPLDTSTGRLGQAPKHFLADPALAATLLDVDADDLLDGDVDEDPALKVVAKGAGTFLGRLFEHLIAMSLQSYAQTAGARLSHLRTRNGDHEIDFIVERKRRIVAFEVKLSPVVRDHDLRHLKWLRDRAGDRLVEAVIITTGDEAYRRSDGIAVVPAALLGV